MRNNAKKKEERGKKIHNGIVTEVMTTATNSTVLLVYSSSILSTALDPIRIYDLIYNKRATMEIVSGHLSSVPYINLSIAPNTTTTTTTIILSRITINV